MKLPCRLIKWFSIPLAVDENIHFQNSLLSNCLIVNIALCWKWYVFVFPWCLVKFTKFSVSYRMLIIWSLPFFFFFFTDQSLPMKTLGSFSWPQGLHPLLHHPQNPVTMSRSYGTHPSASHVSLALCYPFTELECLRGLRAAVMKPVAGIFSPVSGFVPWLCGGVTAGTHR